MSDDTLRILSVRQPYAALIALGVKDVENRTWPTNIRGPVLVHASTRPSGDTLDTMRERFGIQITEQLAELVNATGGIIGAVKIVDCVLRSSSGWFVGPFGFVLANAITLPFTRYRGPQGWGIARDDLRARYRSQLRGWL